MEPIAALCGCCGYPSTPAVHPAGQMYSLYIKKTHMEVALAWEEMPDLAFVSHTLPDRSGLDVCRQLRADPET